MSAPEFVPENDLEVALVAGATSAEARPRFYELLGDAELLVIDEDPPANPAPGPVMLKEGRALKLRQLEIDGVLHVPVFSSPARVSTFVRAEAPFLSLKARDLFGIVREAHLILNPGSQYGKQFTPEEIAGILDGAIFAPRGREVLQEAREVMLGQPSEYPTHVTSVLAAYFKTRKEVRAAYLAHAFMPSTGEPPHTMIGVDVDPGADYDRLMGQAAVVLDGVAKPGEIVDFIRIDGQGVSEYMTTQTKPFYRRRFMGIF